jgi:hypothetical protein
MWRNHEGESKTQPVKQDMILNRHFRSALKNLKIEKRNWMVHISPRPLRPASARQHPDHFEHLQAEVTKEEKSSQALASNFLWRGYP